MKKANLDNKLKLDKSEYKLAVPAVEQALQILIYLGKSTRDKQTLTEISDEMGINKSKVFSILKTMAKYHFIEKDSISKTYSIGPGLVISARNFLINLDQKEIVDPFLKKLAEGTESTALLCLISDKDRVYVASKHEGNQDIGFTVRRGFTFHITHGAQGKAIVALMSDSERDKILGSENLLFYSRDGHVDIKRLDKELEECRRTGFAYDRGELHPGINSISSPLFGPMEKMFGCILLIGNYSEKLIPEYGEKVSNAAKEISHKLGADISHIYPGTG